MADLYRIRVAWDGIGDVGPGTSTFHSQAVPSAAFVSAISGFFNNIKGFFTADVNWTIPNTGDRFDETNGQLLGGWTAGAGSVVTGTASGHNFILGAGARIRWDTTSVVAGHRVRGATFLTSMNAIEFQSDGTPQSTTVASVTGFCTTLLAAWPDLCVWNRPKPVKPPTVPPTYLRLGSHSTIVSGALVDKASWLRSRRT